MAQIIREMRVDVSQPNVFQAIVAKQLDCNSRFLKITLVDFGVKIEVPETAKVTINANRPDGKSQSFVGVANNDGTITVPLAQWMLEVAGELKCDVSVINTIDNKRLTSTDFFVNVQEAANKSTDISENPDGEIRVITPTQKIDENSSDDEYPSAKAVYDLDNITATASGSAITIESSQAPLQNLKLYGHTEQNGTPTPDAPIPLVSVGDSGSFEVGVYSGKNLYKNQGTTRTINGVTFTVYEDGSVNVNGTATAMAQLNLGTTRLPKGNYIASGHHSGDVELYYRAGSIGGWPLIFTERNLNLTQDDNVFLFISVAAGNTADNVTIYPMIRLATETDSTYEPCNKQTLTMPYPLYSMAGHNDEVDFNKGVLIQRCASVTFDGSETWIHNKEYKQFVTNPQSVMALRGTTHKCSHYINERNTDNGLFLSGTPSNAFNFQDARFNGDINAYKEWLSANPVTVVFVRATPQEIPLTETELNAYRQLLTNKGTTNILCSADMELDYYINKPNAQAIGSLHEQINKDYIKLQQAVISTGGSTL